MTAASEQVAGMMRDRIVRGDWTPGSQLPKRTVLVRELAASTAVVQEAVNQLAAEGFVEVRARRLGTRVVPHPPHLSRYILVFPYSSDDYGQFWHALQQAAAGRTTPAREYACFYGLGGHRDIDHFQAVVDQVRTRSVAGLIFASSAGEFKGTPLLEADDIPRVAIAHADQLPGIPKVHVDLEDFMRRAVQLLVKRGRRRIAILCANRAEGMIPVYRAELGRHGLRSRPCWEQFASMKNQSSARNVMELMFLPGQAERPDGLIIADDNFIVGATEGIAMSDISVPKDLEIVAMTNFPNVLPVSLPVTRLGFDIPSVLDLLTTRLEQLIKGEGLTQQTAVRAIFDSEYLG